MLRLRASGVRNLGPTFGFACLGVGFSPPPLAATLDLLRLRQFLLMFRVCVRGLQA